MSNPIVKAISEVSADEIVALVRAGVALLANVVVLAISFGSELYCDLVLTFAGWSIAVIDFFTGAASFGAPPKPHAQRRTCEPVLEADSRFVVDEQKTLARSTFSHSPEALIAQTKLVLASMYKNGELLAEDFQFTAPIVGPLPKDRFLKLWRQADVMESTFPDMRTNAFGFTVDPMEPDRVWFFHRARMTFTGELKIFGGPFPIKGDNTSIVTPPQVQSMRFNDQLKVYALTVGAVVDRCATNNCGGLGGMFGPLLAMNRGLPFPEARSLEKQRSLRFDAGMRLGQTVDAVLGLTVVTRLGKAAQKAAAAAKAAATAAATSGNSAVNMAVKGMQESKGESARPSPSARSTASIATSTTEDLTKAIATPIMMKEAAVAAGVVESAETKG